MCALEQDYLFPAFSPLKSCHVRRNIPFIIYGDSHSCLLCSCYYATRQVQALFFIERFFFVQRGKKKGKEKKKQNPNPQPLFAGLVRKLKPGQRKEVFLQSCDFAQEGGRSRALQCPDTTVLRGISRRSASGAFLLAPAPLRHPHPSAAQGVENSQRKTD